MNLRPLTLSPKSYVMASYSVNGTKAPNSPPSPHPRKPMPGNHMKARKTWDENILAGWFPTDCGRAWSHRETKTMESILCERMVGLDSLSVNLPIQAIFEV